MEATAAGADETAPISAPFAFPFVQITRAGKENAMSSLDSAETLSETRVAQTLNEDWLSVAIGLAVFALALGSLAGADLLGWVVSTSVWTDPGLSVRLRP
jgi:hypothetical protein